MTFPSWVNLFLCIAVLGMNSVHILNASVSSIHSLYESNVTKHNPIFEPFLCKAVRGMNRVVRISHASVSSRHLLINHSIYESDLTQHNLMSQTMITMSNNECSGEPAQMHRLV